MVVDLHGTTSQLASIVGLILASCHLYVCVVIAFYDCVHAHALMNQDHA